MSQFVPGPVLAVVLTLTASAAFAQDFPTSGLALQAPPADATVGEVVIEAPKIVERSRLGVVSGEVSMSVRVPFGDLNLASSEGVAELDRRVKVAANYVCTQLDRRYPQGSPDVFYCAKAAVAEAKPQVIKAHNTQ